MSNEICKHVRLYSDNEEVASLKMTLDSDDDLYIGNLSDKEVTFELLHTAVLAFYNKVTPKRRRKRRCYRYRYVREFRNDNKNISNFYIEYVKKNTTSVNFNIIFTLDKSCCYRDNIGEYAVTNYQYNHYEDLLDILVIHGYLKLVDLHDGYMYSAGVVGGPMTSIYKPTVEDFRDISREEGWTEDLNTNMRPDFNLTMINESC